MLFAGWIAWLISLPLYWAGRLAAAFNHPLSVPLLQAAWWLGGEPEVGVAALALIQRHTSSAVAVRQADRWLARRPCTAIAAYAGLLAVAAGDFDRGWQMFECGRQWGPDRGGLLEGLEYALAGPAGGPLATIATARSFEARNDLGPGLRNPHPGRSADRCDAQPTHGRNRASRRALVEH